VRAAGAIDEPQAVGVRSMNPARNGMTPIKQLLITMLSLKLPAA
jgi:hypothetical protein